MWTFVREYKCTLCGSKEVGGSFGGLPPRWVGSTEEDGDCYCGKCAVKLANVNRCRLLPLDGDLNRLVCSNCGSSFNADDLSIDGNSVPDRCPKCGMVRAAT